MSLKANFSHSAHPPDLSEADARDLLLDRVQLIDEGKQLRRFFEENKIGVSFDSTKFAEITSTWRCVAGRMQTSVAPPGILLGKPFYAAHPGMPWGMFHEGQHTRQVMGDVIEVADKHLSAFDYAVYKRAIEADADANAAINSFKMKLAGNPVPYDFNQNGSLVKPRLAVELYKRDPSSLHDGRMKRMFFDSCYQGSVFRHSYDRQAARGRWAYYDTHLRLDPEAPPRARLMAGDIEKIGEAQSDGINYLKLPGFRRLDARFYTHGFTDRDYMSLREQTAIWENDKRAAHPKLNT